MVRDDWRRPFTAVDRLASASLLALAMIVASLDPALAQTLGCSLLTRPGTPPIDVLTCDGLSIESEKQADVRVLDRAGRGVPDAARVLSGAVLVTVRPGRAVPFQILTPRAIASVRGTRYAVDAGPNGTSVFVTTGTVAVSRPAGGAVLTLDPGEGVDVLDDVAPLVKTRWKRRRVTALLRRLRH